MKTRQLGNSMLCYDDFELDKKPKLLEMMREENLNSLLSQISQEVILVLGGDGTMLRAIRENYSAGIPFLGINFGTLGFLLNDKNWLNAESSFIERQYPLIKVTKDNDTLGVGFNDVNIYSPEGKLIHLDISLEGMGALRLSGDGVIIATPAGSTGHSKSYFGPIVPHVNKALILTPKGNAHTESPKIVSDDTTIFVKNTGRKFDLKVNIDGVPIYCSEYGEGVSLEIKKLTEHVTLLIEDKNTHNWDAKVMQQQGFKL